MKKTVLNSSILIMGFCFLWAGSIKAQPDTIAMAYDHIEAKHFDEATKILNNYSKTFEQPEAIIALANTYYWTDQEALAIQTYQKGLIYHRASCVLRTDYGNLLYEVGKWRRAESHLRIAHRCDPENPEILTKLGWIAFWKGKVSLAKKRAQNALSFFPESSGASELLDEIATVTSPQLRSFARYKTDDQPLKERSALVDFGWYKSQWLAPEARVSYTDFESMSYFPATFKVELGNSFQFGYTGTSVKLMAGIIQQNMNSENTFEATYDIQLNQKIGNSLQLQLQRTLSAYQHTLQSVIDEQVLMHTTDQASLLFNRKNNWLGEATILQQTFDGNEKLYTAYSWLMATPIQTSHFDLRFGYAYSYQDADSITLQAERDEQGNIMYKDNGEIQGTYDPYFSPLDQQIHSILAGIQFKFGETVNCNIRGSFGIWAQAEIPYLYEDQKSSGDIFINKGTVSGSFDPYEFETQFSWQINNSITLSADYIFQRLFFYEVHKGKLGIIFKF